MVTVRKGGSVLDADNAPQAGHFSKPICKVVALGRFREAQKGDIIPRQVLILVEWESRDAFQRYLDDPAIAELHPHREKGAGNNIWHLFDRLEDLRPILKV